jgi:hypothetical protein
VDNLHPAACNPSLLLLLPLTWHLLLLLVWTM